MRSIISFGPRWPVEPRARNAQYPDIRRVNHLFRLLRREPSGVIPLASFCSLSDFRTAGLAMLQVAPWFFGLLAGAIFGVIVDYLDPHSLDASLFGAVGVFACT
jgi:hypothetical protein